MFPEMKNPVPSPDLRPVEGPNNDPEQVTMRQRADEWRKIANERLAERRRLNGQGYAGKAEH
jgi:hypothetical protein